ARPSAVWPLSSPAAAATAIPPLKKSVPANPGPTSPSSAHLSTAADTTPGNNKDAAHQSAPAPLAFVPKPAPPPSPPSPSKTISQSASSVFTFFALSVTSACSALFFVLSLSGSRSSHASYCKKQKGAAQPRPSQSSYGKPRTTDYSLFTP